VNTNPLNPTFPCGITRRQALWQAGAGFFGTAMTAMLAQDGFFASRALGAAGAAIAKPSPTAPLAARPPQFPGRAKRVIFLYMVGGPSHVDTFDPKPELTKRHGQKHSMASDKTKAMSQRASGELKGSPFQFSPCGQSGVPVSELFRHVGKCVDDIAVVRSVCADSAAHGSASIQMNTGFLRPGFPSLGSWAVYGLGTLNQNMPGFVVLVNGAPYSGTQNWSSGFMPAAYQGTVFNHSGDPILNLRPASSASPEEQKRQLDLLASFNAAHRQHEPMNTELAARIANYELAFRMQASAPDVVDLSQESKATLEMYGLEGETRKETEKFGRSCLMARRLVERGVRFVQIYHSNWDTHGDNDNRHRKLCGETDKPIGALLADLKQRGLLEDTLVVWGGEFGRTPFGTSGRDHHAAAFTMWMAGGGVKGGQAYGTTDDLGFGVVENRVHVHDLHATILHLLGFDHELLTYFHGGRDHRLTDVHGHVVKGLIA
jgi:hypothetical protein